MKLVSITKLTKEHLAALLRSPVKVITDVSPLRRKYENICRRRS